MKFPSQFKKFNKISNKIFKREKIQFVRKKLSIFPRKVFYGISNLIFIFWEEWDGNSFEMVFDPRFVLFCLFVSFLSFRMIELLQIEISICLIGIDGILSEFSDEPQFFGFLFSIFEIALYDRSMDEFFVRNDLNLLDLLTLENTSTSIDQSHNYSCF
jgi:hypothetical protein